MSIDAYRWYQMLLCLALLSANPPIWLSFVDGTFECCFSYQKKLIRTNFLLCAEYEMRKMEKKRHILRKLQWTQTIVHFNYANKNKSWHKTFWKKNNHHIKEQIRKKNLLISFILMWYFSWTDRDSLNEAACV